MKDTETKLKKLIGLLIHEVPTDSNFEALMEMYLPEFEEILQQQQKQHMMEMALLESTIEQRATELAYEKLEQVREEVITTIQDLGWIGTQTRKELEDELEQLKKKE